mgnify:FL=1
MNAIDRSTDGVRPVPRARGGTSDRRSLARQVERARLWLPLTIVGIVLLFELGLVTRLGAELGATVRLDRKSVV